MARVIIRPPKDAKCSKYRTHFLERVKERQFLLPMAKELDTWLKEGHYAPDLVESPEGQGWYKQFDSFLILGEGECIKTVYTIYSPGNPRLNSIDIDEYEKPPEPEPAPSLPVPPAATPPKTSSEDIAAALFGDDEV